jgi:hypothetical protein
MKFNLALNPPKLTQPLPVCGGTYPIFKIDYTAQLPASVDLSTLDYVPISNQFTVGMCTAEDLTENIEAYLGMEAQATPGTDGPDFSVQSAFFNYYNSRTILFGAPPTTDTGSTTEAALLAAGYFGSCPESLWPSTDATLTEAVPPTAAYTAALNTTITGFEKILTSCYYPVPPAKYPMTFISWQTYEVQQFWLMYALAKGYAVNADFLVGEQIETMKAGQIYYPMGSSQNPGSQIGGHSVRIVGYETVTDPITGNATPCFKIQNSWGAAWGEQGFFWASIAIISDCTAAFVVTQVTNNGVVINGPLGPDLTTHLSPPTSASTVDQAVQYVFVDNFGRMPNPGGQTLFANAVIAAVKAQIVSSAGAGDLAFMAAPGWAPSTAYTPPTEVSTLAQVVTWVFQTYFGRIPAAPGLSIFVAWMNSWLQTSIVAGAGAKDLAYMQDHAVGVLA